MTRSKRELQESKDRLTAGMAALREELRIVERELLSLERGTTLNEAFFWEYIVPLLAKSKGGLTSAQILNKLSEIGNEINPVNLRTFLSRNKSRGNLMTFDLHSPVRWQVTPYVAKLAQGLGVAISEQPASWKALAVRQAGRT